MVPLGTVIVLVCSIYKEVDVGASQESNHYYWPSSMLVNAGVICQFLVVVVLASKCK